jgi:hypothetical protein
MDPRAPHHLCSCGARFSSVRSRPGARWSRDNLRIAPRRSGCTREMMPLGEWWRSARVHAAHSRARPQRQLKHERLYMDRSSAPPAPSRRVSVGRSRRRSISARDDRAAVTRQRRERRRRVSAAAGLACGCSPEGEKRRTPISECQLYGAGVTLVTDLITDAGRVAAETSGPLRMADVSTQGQSRIGGNDGVRDRQAPEWTGAGPTGSSIRRAAARA